MSNAYLYTFSMKGYDRDDVAEYLDSLDGVDDWFYSLPNSIFIIGSIPAKQLSALLVKKFGKHRHFITKVSDSARAGWMPNEHWPRLRKNKD